MSALLFEDFACGPEAPAPDAGAEPAQEPEAEPAPLPGYEEGYAEGWAEAMRQVEAEGTRVSEGLAAALARSESGQAEAMAAALDSLAPALREIFDRLLPHAADRAFLPILMEELRAAHAEAPGNTVLLVAGDDLPRVEPLLARGIHGAAGVDLRADPSLVPGQALIRWNREARRIDLEAVLAALDTALEDLITTRSQETGPTSACETDILEEAAHG